MTITTSVQDEIEKLLQLVIAARHSADVEAEAEEALDRLRSLHAEDPTQFTPENVRWINVLRGYLGVRLAAHGPKAGPFARVAKRKGDTLEHCWRCQTPVDVRFTEICPTCDSKPYHWRVCPVCKACGCQKTGKALV